MHQEFISKLSTYNITEHRHNFACWTAARAAQRGYKTTKIITDAIEAAQLREKLSELIIQGATVEKYDVFHETMANELIRILKSKEEDLQKLENKSNGKSGEITKEKNTYGKPILERTIQHSSDLAFALKVGFLAFNATITCAIGRT